MGWSAINRKFILASIVLILVAAVSRGQNSTSSLRGTVTDARGAVGTWSGDHFGELQSGHHYVWQK